MSLNQGVRKTRAMQIPWQDFFRPDLSSSNRALKKFLQGEGLEFKHRDLVLLRKLCEAAFYFSYAALETWAEGELEQEDLASLLALDDEALKQATENLGLNIFQPQPDCTLLFLPGEIELPSESAGSASNALVHQPSAPSSSPLVAVFGLPSGSPGVGGVWDEEDLARESVVLLDGESSLDLVEAFRHLFRAAPDGAARASVVATALSRHRAELNKEVAQKLEEISSPFGQALRQLFSGTEDEGAKALSYLLGEESKEDPSAWVNFWTQIRPTILKSLSENDRGTKILVSSLDLLSGTLNGADFLNAALLEAFLCSLLELDPGQQEGLTKMTVDWALEDGQAIKDIQSRLELTTEKVERLFLGETLRRVFSQLEDQEALRELARFFVVEAISEGSTANAIALADLLRSFGELVLGDTVVTQELSDLSHRQVLNVIEIWELFAADSERFHGRITELYLQALDQAEDHLSPLLKSELLQLKSIFSEFESWLKVGDEDCRRRVLSTGFSWSLAVDNRERVAQVLRQCEWGFAELWLNEWGRPHLSFQRLGWLAQCVAADKLQLSTNQQERIAQLLSSPSHNLYFWHFLSYCAEAESFSQSLRDRTIKSGFRAFRTLESNQEQERESLFLAAATAICSGEQSEDFWSLLAQAFRTGSTEEVWWWSGVFNLLYRSFVKAPEPPKALVSAIIHRLMTANESSMSDLLAQALNADDTEPEVKSLGLTLEINRLCYLALAAVAGHPTSSPSLAMTIKRRLVMSLITWTKQLQKTDDPYSFRDTPLFGILKEYVAEENEALQELLVELVRTLLELQRQSPQNFRLDVRQEAQVFLHSWSVTNPSQELSEIWLRFLRDF